MERWEASIMNPRRLATVVAMLAVVLAGWAVAWLAGFGATSIENTGAAPIMDRPPPSLSADAEVVDAPQARTMGNTVVTAAAGAATVAATNATAAPDESADAQQATAMGDSVVAVAPAAVTVPATNTTAARDDLEPVAEAASTDAPRTLPPEAPPIQVATANPSDLLPNDTRNAVSSIEIPGGCEATDACIDHYLWALYQRTPKEDTIKVEEQRKVAVKKKGKTVTVTRSFTKLVDEDFTWKDPKAAEKAGMPMMDYVIGGMDRGFKLKLFHTLRAADEAGLSPGITSAFRDDYRQSLASGLKAATDRSYHGGSSRGGYGHGLAADIVSVKGETRDQRYGSSENLWKWIDAHGEEFGIGRPYLDRDPPHVAPIDGLEYAHHRGTEARHAGSEKRSRLARDNHNSGKRSKTARSSKVRTI
jgi:hypothetical protein